MSKTKIVLLSGGSLVGRNLLDVFETSRENFYLIALNSVPEEPSLFEFDEVYLSPELGSQESDFLEFFSKLISDIQPDFVIPCRDEDVYFLAKWKANNDQLTPNSILSGSIPVAESFLDKWKSYKLSESLGLPFAKTISSEDEEPSILNFAMAVGYPLIAKPKMGFASRGVFLITEENQLRAFIGLKNYIIQEYLGSPTKIADYLEGIKIQGIPLFHSFEETKISVQASIGPNGQLGGYVVTTHLMKQGVSTQIKRCLDESILYQAQNWIHSLIKAGWVGPLNIQCQLDQNQKLVIYEFNGRFTGATSARYFLGYDELGILLQLWKGIDVKFDFGNVPISSVKRVPMSKYSPNVNFNTLLLDRNWKRGG